MRPSSETAKYRWEELKHRIEAKKLELEAKLEHAKADSSAKAAENPNDIRRKLDELNDHLRIGWDNMTEEIATKLDGWLNKKPN